MTAPIPQPILDALTDVEMPRLPPERPAPATVALGGWRLPHHRAGCLVVGSGAAGLRAAVELRRRGVDALILSQSAWGGTSACSGSDKQTLHTANAAGRGDDFQAMARAIRAGGAMTRTPPTSRRWARRAPWPRCSTSACRCRRIASAARCATRPTTTRSAAPPAAVRAPRG